MQTTHDLTPPTAMPSQSCYACRFYLQLERDWVEREEKIAERAAAEREARAERSERAAAERAEREARFAMVLVASVALVVSSMVLARARS